MGRKRENLQTEDFMLDSSQPSVAHRQARTCVVKTAAMNTNGRGKPAKVLGVSPVSEAKGLEYDMKDGVKVRKKTVISKLGQRVNVAGIQFTSKVILCEQYLAVPHISVLDIRIGQVGDLYFIDVVFGNKNGLLTIKSAPLTSVGEPYIVRKVRKFEEAAVGRWQRRKVQPREHVLFTSHYFIKDFACR